MIPELDLHDQLDQPLERWKSFCIDHVTQALEDEVSLLERIGPRIFDKTRDLPKASEALISRLPTHKREMFDLLKPFTPKPERASFAEANKPWLEMAEQIAGQIPLKVKKYQLPERFHASEGDGLWKLAKGAKLFSFHVTRIPLYLSNILRKNKKEVLYWRHYPSLQGLFRYHFMGGFIQEWIDLNKRITVELCQLLTEIKSYEETFCSTSERPSPPDILSRWSSFRKDILARVNEWFDSANGDLMADLELAGTWEYSNSKLESRSLQRRFEKNSSQWEVSWENWGNTRFSLFENWCCDLELEGFQYYVSHLKSVADQAFVEWQQEVQNDHLQPIQSFLSKTKAAFDQVGSDELAKHIAVAHYEIKKTLGSEMIKPLEDKLIRNSLLNQINRIEHLVDQRIETLQEEHTVVKTESFDVPLGSDELQTVSNYDLISFEIQPWFNQELQGIKNSLLNDFNEQLVQVGDIDEVVSFTLDTALLNQKESDQEKDLGEGIVKDGFDRAFGKVGQIDQDLSEILAGSKTQVGDALEKLRIKIQELTETEEVANIRLRIKKAKAIQQSRALLTRLTEILAARFRVVRSLVRAFWNKAVTIKKRIVSLVLPTATSAVPSRDVSDYLDASNKIIENLPAVYRRIYAIEPLSDPVLFVGRQKELGVINKAFENWRNDRFGSVLITGEKWSGRTSLVNYLLSQGTFSYPVSRYVCEGNLSQIEDLYQIMARLLGQKSFKSSAEIIKYLNDSEKRIIIIEDLENLYLRKVNGMMALTELADIVASTHKEVFWIASLSIYAGQYLEKVMQISSYFSYPVTLGDFDPDQISDLITTRNRISGFKIQFEPLDGASSDKKLAKMDPKEQQAYLKEQFFDQLNDFARSNVSMALLYWLLSTKEVTQSTILISSFEKPDLSFLTKLSPDRVLVLHCLVLHDGLNAAQTAQVLSFPAQKTKMMLLALEEDGILFRNQDVFMVSALVYRSVIHLLKSKNLIY